MQFERIPGRESLKKQIIQGIIKNKVPHAQLFSGAEGSGALAFAMAYAQYLFCNNRSETDSCGKCPACQKVSKLIHPDLHFSFPFATSKKEDTASAFIVEWREQVAKNPFFSLEDWTISLSLENKMVNIPISECRQILRDLSLKAYEGGYQVLILWLPEFLKESANSLLKLLEEPSPDTLFLLVTENKDLILPTLLSRTQQISVPTPTLREVETFLERDFGINPNASETIAFLSEGNLAKAVGMANGAVDQFRESFEEWLQLLKAGNGHHLVEWVENFNGKAGKSGLSKEDKKNFILYSIKMFRKIYFPASGDQEVQSKNQEWSLETSRVDLSNFENIIQELEKAAFHLERNSNPKILFLDVSLQIVQYLNRRAT